MQKFREFSTQLFYLMLFIGLTHFQALAGDTKNDSIPATANLKFKPSALIIPSTLIALGAAGMESKWIKSLNDETREELQENIDEHVTIDNFTQYAPMASVYLLNAVGVKGKHNFKDRTIILASAYLVMGISVTTLKETTRVMRPDGSSRNSFPSGHTATAFMGAEFLYQEYKDESVWYGVAGFTVATATGFYRMYNNRHWLTDVVAGAGFGILSAKIGYWVHPLFQSKTENKTNNSALQIDYVLPYLNGHQTGMSASIRF